MVNSHSSYTTYKLEIREMIFIAKSRVWIDLQSIVISEVEGGSREEKEKQNVVLLEQSHISRSERHHWLNWVLLLMELKK